MVAWQVLTGNLAFVALTISLWAHLQFWLLRHTGRRKDLIFGVMMGCGAIASMLLSVESRPGIFFDLRGSLIAVSGLFGGPFSVAVACVIAGSFRAAIGGEGAVYGVAGMALAGLIGVAGRATCSRKITYPSLIVLSVLIACVPLGSIALLAPPSTEQVFWGFDAPIFILNFAATLTAGAVVLQLGRLALERDLLRAALTQAPDFSYVKDRDSRFVITNERVATYNGFEKPEQMIGLSDFAIATSQRAKGLFETEQRIMATGAPIDGFEELLVAPDGTEKWFSTSKVALKDSDGTIIGLAGATRDITERKRLEQAHVASSNLLSHAMTEMSDGLAMFDEHGILVFCNDQYRNSFPLTGAQRQPGTHIRDILRAVIESGEQTSVPAGAEDVRAAESGTSLTRESEEEIGLVDGRWLKVRTRQAGDGSALVMVSDNTNVKTSELALKSLAEQLRLLAETDGLTDLLNRRAFDQALDRELSRARRTKAPLSLLLIDIDRFKAYNDYYGHLAGDDCLRKVAKCLKQVVRRPADIVARYGGEEFAIILPETGESGAHHVAEQLRLALRQHALQHVGSEHGVVTISIGLAMLMHKDACASDLIARADDALYGAKAAGRDRSYFWREGYRKGQFGGTG
ncbi:MAG: hypothetical protein JWM58_3379 [Rhizobium sp.]|nr:hypothetical protein [Rhizobium sp.]